MNDLRINEHALVESGGSVLANFTCTMLLLLLSTPLLKAHATEIVEVTYLARNSIRE